MALFIPGPTVSVVSGKLGGVVYSRGVGGPIIRQYVIPTKVVSEYTTFIRGITTSLSQAYGALAAGEKSAWANWAATHQFSNRIGQPITLQPSAAFMKINHRILELGFAQIDNPPIDTPPAGVTGQGVVAAETGASCVVSWTSGALGANDHLVVWIALLDSPGRAYYTDRLRLVDYGVAAGTTPVDVAADVIARFGTLLAGQQVKCELQVWNDQTGLVSGTVFAETIVGA